MTDRDAFLARIRRSLSGVRRSLPLPSLDAIGSGHDDPVFAFAHALRAAAGRVYLLPGGGSLESALLDLDCYRTAKAVCSLVPSVERHNVDLSSLEDARSLNHVGVAVLDASLGVAENGAVWLALENTLHRALLFLSEHVVLVLDRRSIVDNMHRAYEQIDVAGTCYGCFVCGPSKTADIEQALVIGAHGPRSLTVVLT
jgi:L-lactate dehydrogenase complex protein LldG